MARSQERAGQESTPEPVFSVYNHTDSSHRGKISTLPAQPYLKITRELGCMTRHDYQAFVRQQTAVACWLDKRAGVVRR